MSKFSDTSTNVGLKKIVSGCFSNDRFFYIRSKPKLTLTSSIKKISLKEFVSAVNQLMFSGHRLHY